MTNIRYSMKELGNIKAKSEVTTKNKKVTKRAEAKVSSVGKYSTKVVNGVKYMTLN